MRITQITVSYGETQSLPEYSNVKPNITLTAVLDEGDISAEIEVLLWQSAKTSVHEQIDAALESSGRAAKYSTERRYQVLQTYWNQWDHRGETKPPQYVVILPNEINPDRGAYAQRLTHFGPGEARKLRYEHALRAAQQTIADKDESDYTLIDCSDGDLSRLEAALGTPSPERPTAQPGTAEEMFPYAHDTGDEVDFDEEFEDDE